MHNPYRGGTFDDWYSGDKADIWVEYKWEDNPLSALQEEWGKARYKEGRRVYVIHGYKDRGALYKTPKSWTDGVGGINMTKAEIVAWLVSQTMRNKVNGNSQSRSPNGKRVQNNHNRSTNI
jgi:hypothetical protein